VTVTVTVVDGARVLDIGQTYLEVQLLATLYYLRRNGRAT
jgi:hypothetical protein